MGKLAFRSLVQILTRPAAPQTVLAGQRCRPWLSAAKANIFEIYRRVAPVQSARDIPHAEQPELFPPAPRPQVPSMPVFSRNMETTDVSDKSSMSSEAKLKEPPSENAFPNQYNGFGDRKHDRNNGHHLGRDDPLWPRYVEEAEKWDDIMMSKWDSSMDVLLLFATLFSAIVTAFVIETSGSLEPDNAAVSAAALIQIAETLRGMANGEPPSQNITAPLPSLAEFQPGTNDFLVNFLWFVSLSLSITVALLASLVKQWCNSYTTDRTAPPCNQARIRQARFNQLIAWRTEWIVSALPIIMHIALGLFLIGLILFLWKLSWTIYVATLVITATTGLFYAGTTIIPFFSAFSPYGTPLSSLKAWGYVYQLVYFAVLHVYKTFAETDAQADLVTFRSPCEEQEQRVSYNTTPDEITGDALNWIIIHSPSSKTRDMAIRAIAGLESKKTLKQLVADPPGIFPQVVQGFTACFSRSFSEDEVSLAHGRSIDEVSLHGSALAILADLMVPASCQDDPEYLVKWGVDDNTKLAVKLRFQWLAGIENDSHASAMGLIGLSAWYEFVGHEASRFNRGHIVNQLSHALKWDLPEHLVTRIIHALMIESVYWAPDVDSENIMGILSRLLKLVETAPPNNLKLRSRLACALAVLVLGLNRGSTHLKTLSDPETEDLEAGKAQSSAASLLEYYVKNPSGIDRDEQALLLFALSGLMEYYEHCDFNEETYANMKVVANQLAELGALGKPQDVMLHKDTGLLLDIRDYFVEILALYLKQTRVPQRSGALDETFAQLLKAIRNKRQVWIDYGSFLMLPIIQILAHTNNLALQSECLSIIVANWDSGPSLLYTHMLFSCEVPHKLVQLIHDLNYQTSATDEPHTIIYSNTAIIFEKFVTQLAEKQLGESDFPVLHSFIDHVLRNNLLHTLVRNILDLKISPRSSDFYGLDASPMWSPGLWSTVALYAETIEYLKRRPMPQAPLSEPNPGQAAGPSVRTRTNATGSETEPSKTDMFLKTLFNLHTQKEGIDRWSSYQGKPQDNRSPLFGGAEIAEERLDTGAPDLASKPKD